MRQSSELYERFLEEMRSLETFRTVFMSQHPTAALDREDPDVTRIIEALAYFNSSSRYWVRLNQLKTIRRIFRQFFNFLLDPLPSMAILRANVTSRFVEATRIPAGTEIKVEAAKNARASFFTVWDQYLLPIRLTRVEVVDKIGRGHRLLLRFRSPYPRNDEIGLLSIYINQLNDYYSSLSVLQGLRDHMRGCSIAFGENVTSETQGEPCQVSFGPPKQEGQRHDRFNHPIERIRTFFHFPEAELFMNIDVTTPAYQWSQFTVLIDLAETWPGNPGLTTDTFVLGAVPIVNLKREMAEPVFNEGVESRFPLVYSGIDEFYEFHSVKAVYEVTDDGYKPLKPGVLPVGGSAYEIEWDDLLGQGKQNKEVRRSFVLLKLPECFENPKFIAVDGYWHQPWFAEYAGSRLKTYLYDRTIVGLEWGLITKIQTTQENPIRNNVDALLQILALRMSNMLNLQQIRLILSALGSVERSMCKDLPRLIDEITIEKLPPRADEKTGLKLRYHVHLRAYHESQKPLVEVFFLYLKDYLNTWVSETLVEIRVHLPDDGKVINFV